MLKKPKTPQTSQQPSQPSPHSEKKTEPKVKEPLPPKKLSDKKQEHPEGDSDHTIPTVKSADKKKNNTKHAYGDDDGDDVRFKLPPASPFVFF